MHLLLQILEEVKITDSLGKKIEIEDPLAEETQTYIVTSDPHNLWLNVRTLEIVLFPAITFRWKADPTFIRPPDSRGVAG